MPDTLIDPIPATVREEARARDGGGETPPGRARRRRGCAAAAGAALVALAAAAAIGFYFFFWRYEPTARLHIPGDANLAFRLEMSDVARFGPARRHLGPLLDDTRSGKKRGARLLEATGMNPDTDVREIVIASTDASSWVVLLGGRIPRGAFVEGLARLARDEGWPGWRVEGDLLRGPGGVAVGQADDGTVAVGTDAEVVRAALPASDEWQRLDLPERGAVAFSLTELAWSGMGGALGSLLPHGGSGLFRRTRNASGTMSLSDAPAVTMRVKPAAGETAAALAGDLETALRDLTQATAARADRFGELSALRSAKVTALADAVEVRATWPREGIERACEHLARAVNAAGADANATGADVTSATPSATAPPTAASASAGRP